MNTIVFHPWASLAGDTDNPVELRIDLDPQPRHGLRGCRGRRRTRCARCCARPGSTAFVKTSGNRGIHVFCPIEPTHEFLDVRHAVIAAARELERRMPDKVTTNWWKEERGERIFVDFNQANRDRTMAGAYSPRALPTATVSTPVTWDELDGVDPATLHGALGAAAARRHRRPVGGLPRQARTHRHAARVVAARPVERARRAAVPARLPEDAG